MAGFVEQAEINLLIIDPQSDFIDAPYEDSPFGRLPVVGAKRDIGRISKLINTYKSKIDKIFVSLDTHTIFHIGHRFWREIKQDGTDGSIAPPGTIFTIQGDKIIGSDNKCYQVNVSREDGHRDAMNAYAMAYLSKVIKEGAEDGRNLPCTWAVHCIQGTKGWNIDPELAKVLNANDVKSKVEYHIKGQNQLAEMYSIMKAEIPYEDVVTSLTDHEKEIVKLYTYNPISGDNPQSNEYMIPNAATLDVNVENLGNVELSQISKESNDIYDLKTTFNDKLFGSLTENDADIWVCGEALSHCVQFSTRDIVKEISKKELKNKVYLIQNASSYVNLDAIGLPSLTNLFKDSGHAFIELMKCSKLEPGAFTGTKEINSSGKLVDVPCIRGTTASDLFANKGRNRADELTILTGIRGGSKKSKKSKKIMKKRRRSQKKSRR
jgi:nicotinamidase-related amidase